LLPDCPQAAARAACPQALAIYDDASGADDRGRIPCRDDGGRMQHRFEPDFQAEMAAGRMDGW
jgi:hypothetical protein